MASLAGAIFLFCLLISAQPLDAQDLSVATQYRQSAGSTQASFMAWAIRIQKTGGETTEYVFSPQGQTQPVCRVRVVTEEKTRHILWQASDIRLADRKNDDILLVSGFPAPCDVLPTTQKDAQQDYEERVTVGSATFLRKYRVSKTEIDAADVYRLASGLSGKALPEKLLDFTVVDAGGLPVCRQIWIPGDSWWVYEETPFQRSWRQ